MFFVATIIAAFHPLAHAGNAYPGAVGYGSETYGGMPTGTEETNVIRVTNLNADGAGSLKAALETQGRRLIVFEVGGVIDLGGPGGVSRLNITDPHVTIAGQTAPGPGITITKGDLLVNTHDVVIRHLRVRPGDAGQPKQSGWEPDGLSTGRNAYNVVLDHISATWAVDENMTTGAYSNSDSDGDGQPDLDGTSHNITISNSLIAEGLSDSTHAKGEHSKGTLLMDGNQKISHIGNLLISNVDRNPFVSAAESVFVNNFVTNFGSGRVFYARNGGHPSSQYVQQSEITAVGNYVQAGPSSNASNVFIPAHDTANNEPAGEKAVAAYLRDNTRLEWDGSNMQTITGSYELATEALDWPEGLTPLEAYKVPAWVTAHAGAMPWSRDAIDQRLIDQARNNNGSFIDSQNEVGGYPEYEPVTRPVSVPADQGELADWLAGFEQDIPEPVYPEPPAEPTGIGAVHDATIIGLNPDDGTANNAGDSATLDVRFATEAGAGYQRMAKSYIRFDLPEDIDTLDAAALILYWARDDRAGKTIAIYGLNEADAYGEGELGEDWTEDAITWNNAPANPTNGDDPALVAEHVTQLGQITSPASPGHVTLTSEAMLGFLPADTDGTVTFILIAPENDATLGRFSSSETDNGPLLNLDYEPIPEPTGVAMMGLGGLALFARRR